MKKEEFEKKKIFSEASGSISIVNSNIEMKLNEFGLFEETLKENVSEIDDYTFEVSPNFVKCGNEHEIAKKLYSNLDGMNYDERLGYYNSLYVGYVSEGHYRENASSGGIGTWIFKEMLDNNLIDYVIHVKFNEDNNSQLMFNYEISSTIQELMKGAKTKYYPVEFSEVIETVKNTPGRYAIIGIPSFIYSIRLLSNSDPIIKERIKYTVGLICGHQKSSKFAESMAWQMGIKPGKLKYIDFRHKLKDLPADQYAVKAVGEINGELKTIITPTSELFGQNWGWGLFKSFASDFTDDVFNETADIVLGDAWLPEYTKDSEGNNIVIVRNSELNHLIKKAQYENRLYLTEVDKEIIFKSQASHYRHTHDELSYRLNKLEKENLWHPKKRVSENSIRVSRNRKKIQDLRSEISKKSHYAYAKAVEIDDFDYFVKQLEPLITQYNDIYIKEHRKKMLLNIKTIGYSVLLKKIIKKLFKN